MIVFWLASIFGPLLLINGIWCLVYKENLVKIISSIKANPAAFWLFGFLNLFLGLFIISYYNVWDMNMGIFVTLLGWVLLIRGLLSFFAPKTLIAYTMTNPKFIKIFGFIPLIWGVILCWIAFFV